jgi:hypothetical protein
MARSPEEKPSVTRRLWQTISGFMALAALWALFFALLRWRVDTPEEHLNLGRVTGTQLQRPGQ